MTAAEERARSRRGVRPFLLVPLLVFAGVAAIFLLRLESGGGGDVVPSVLIGKPAPDFDLPPLEGGRLPGLARGDLHGGVTVVNVFASWCGPCRLEHPQLETLAEDGRIRVVGINYKDDPANARRFLEELGNPFAAIGADERGRTAIDWGVYGVPETFIVGADGVVRHKHIGPISEEDLARTIRPAVEAALAAAPAD